MENYKSLHDEILPAYEIPEGKAAYDSTLSCLQKTYPQYLEEMQGIVDGARIQFHHVFIIIFYFYN